jgi:hypothetical protein
LKTAAFFLNELATENLHLQLAYLSSGFDYKPLFLSSLYVLGKIEGFEAMKFWIE